MVIERARQSIDAVGTPRAIAIALLGFAALLASTWKQLVQSLYIGLTGREWLIKASVFLRCRFSSSSGRSPEWIIDNGRVQAALWDALPWIAAVLVVPQDVRRGLDRHAPLSTAGCSATARS